ncbi:MAG: phosphoribosylamine--glycine ligase [Deltaproteobacteria bacterium]|nr:phosphoribosylamine--glycine ligase [Deltaproteobacteria bacterium]
MSNGAFPILLLGGGGREHALAWKLAQSPLCRRLFVAPGNPGISSLGAKVDCVNLSPTDASALLAFAREHNVGLVVCGPEAPLVAGVGDAFAAAHIPFFGPSQAAAEIEGSKAFAKDVMAKANVPTAAYGTFTDVDEADAFIAAQGRPVVVKADGLCAGKGVEVTSTAAEAQAAVRRMLSDRVFGESGARVVIEERLLGRETSILGMCDGERFVLLASSEDHKAVRDGDQGPNTGGMGAYSPSPLVSDALMSDIGERIFKPTLRQMAALGRPFRGLLYAGLILTPDRGPMVIEFNCRFGDPETQAVLPRLVDDLVPWMLGAAQGHLPQGTLTWRPGTSVCVVMAAANYPGAPRVGDEITHLPPVAEQDPDRSVLVFHAGTKQLGDKVVTSGGRVLGITAVGEDLASARQRAYAAVKNIAFSGAHYRSDIGLRGQA